MDCIDNYEDSKQIIIWKVEYKWIS
jgi:hypothetical protein